MPKEYRAFKFDALNAGTVYVLFDKDMTEVDATKDADTAVTALFGRNSRLKHTKGMKANRLPETAFQDKKVYFAWFVLEKRDYGVWIQNGW